MVWGLLEEGAGEGGGGGGGGRRWWGWEFVGEEVVERDGEIEGLR